MTKQFCDLCGEPASTATPVEVVHRIDPTKADPTPSIRTYVTFAWVNNPSNFQGPPDLCNACALTLLGEVVSQEQKPKV